ncbi:uncharacterized protein LOC9646722 [Selaginella moellendorffii]|uniref:uncharacterized protein LOC9646722 n=1 Tax=Selaginella moellendorffii TaxID=88036 RepID=UPI000D1CCEA2|nr:uncharacterized protein LOC9646722 [Selaginella moellendorffii]|eukprot:XP_024530679.1 uncharacterized protein LOC9646722 [Selaginella moellendorffii]
MAFYHNVGKSRCLGASTEPFGHKSIQEVYRNVCIFTYRDAEILFVHEELGDKEKLMGACSWAHQFFLECIELKVKVALLSAEKEDWKKKEEDWKRRESELKAEKDLLLERESELRAGTDLLLQKLRKSFNPEDPWKRILHSYRLETLPSRQSLARFLQIVPDGLSIPLAPWTFTRLAATESEYRRAFTCGEPGYHCQMISRQIDLLLDLYDKPEKIDWTENAWISHWDSWFMETIFFCLPDDCPVVTGRDTSYYTSTGTKRPHSVLYVLPELIGVFRGEEKRWAGTLLAGIEKAKSPLVELETKPVWMFYGLEYILGYAAVGPEVFVVALHEDSTGVYKIGKSRAQQLLHFKRDTKGSLPEILICLFNIVRIIPVLGRICRELGVERDIVVFESPRKMVRLNGFKPVKKTYDSEEAWRNVQEIYEAIGLVNEIVIPEAGILLDSQHEYLLRGANIERLIGHQEPVPGKKKGSHLFYPRLSYAAKPRNGPELVEALLDTIKALEHLHKLGWMHRDVRWPNIRRSFDTGTWWLIDLDDAAMSPQLSAPKHLAAASHAPELSLGSGEHGKEVDIWSLGYLIRSWQSEHFIRPDLDTLSRILMQTDPAARGTLDDARRELERIYKMM